MRAADMLRVSKRLRQRRWNGFDWTFDYPSAPVTAAAKSRSCARPSGQRCRYGECDCGDLRNSLPARDRERSGSLPGVREALLKGVFQ